jgi:hypothetical protein
MNARHVSERNDNLIYSKNINTVRHKSKTMINIEVYII